MQDSVGWIAAAFGLILAVYFGLRVREEKRKAGAERQRAEDLGSDRDASEARVERLVRERRERAEELTRLRRKLDKRKRQPELDRASAEREQKLAGELAQARRDTAAAIRERDAAQAGQSRAEALLAQESDPEPVRRVERERDLAREELSRARADMEQSSQALARIEDELARVRKRADNLDKVYLVLRGQHALAQDELRAKDARIERLEALRVALAEDPPASPTSPAMPEPGQGDDPVPREE